MEIDDRVSFGGLRDVQGSCARHDQLVGAFSACDRGADQPVAPINGEHPWGLLGCGVRQADPLALRTIDPQQRWSVAAAVPRAVDNYIMTSHKRTGSGTGHAQEQQGARYTQVGHVGMQVAHWHRHRGKHNSDSTRSRSSHGAVQCYGDGGAGHAPLGRSG